MALRFEIIVSRVKTTVEQTLEEYLKTKDAHSLMILGFCYVDGQYHILVRYREKI